MESPFTMLEIRREETPEDLPFQVADGPALSYAAWYRGAASLRRIIAEEMHVAPGARVLLVTNREQWPEFAVGYLGILAAGGTVVTVSSGDSPEFVHDMAESLHTQATIAIGAHNAAIFEALSPCYELVLSEVVGRNEARGLNAVDWKPASEGEILFTSGTNGPRKAIGCCWEDLCSTLGQRVGTPSDTFSNQSTLVHHALPGTQASQRILLQALRSNRLSSVNVVRRSGRDLFHAIRRYDAQFVGLVPSTARELLSECEREQVTFANVKWVSMGSEAVPLRVLEDLTHIFPSAALMNMYGLTEAGAFRICGVHPLPRFSVGRPEPGCRVEIRHDLDGPVDTGRPGELWVTREESAQRRYVNNIEETDRTFCDGWVRTGDVAWVDDQGYVYLAGRTSETIELGNTRVYPLLIEECLRMHPNVADVAVYRASKALGEHLTAAVVFFDRNGRDVVPAVSDLLNYCREHLPPHEVPTAYLPCAQIPIGPFGTVQKRILRKFDSSQYSTDGEEEFIVFRAMGE